MLHQVVLAKAHELGHEGVENMLHHLHVDFYISGAHRAVQEFVCACPTCLKNKSEHFHTVGLLQLLEVSSTVWVDVAMDFIEGLPRVNGKSVILTIVDRFSKFVHFITLGHSYTTTSVARAFFDTIVWLHGSGVHEKVLAGVVRARRCQATLIFSVPPTVRRAVKSNEQNYNDVPPLPLW
jgi:hypothetical protein